MQFTWGLSMKQGKFLTLFLPLLVLLGCTGKGAIPKNTLQLNLGGEPHSLDPRKARELGALTLSSHFFEGLTRIGPDLQPHMAMAKEVLVSRDRLKYKFLLREAKWSDGSVVCANDFVESWKRLLDSSFPSPTAFHLYVIKGAKERREGKGNLVPFGAVAIDEKTVLVELVHPTAHFLEMLALPVFFPVHQRVDLETPHWAESVDQFVSNGPFLFKEWRHNDQIVAVKNPTYWDAESVSLEEIRFCMLDEKTELTLFEKGELQWAGSPLSTLSLDALPSLREKNQLEIRPVAGTRYISVNTEDPLLSHPKIRRALALAIDREAIVTHVTQGGQLPSIGFVPASFHLARKPYYQDRDVDTARLLFKEGLSDLGISEEAFSGVTLTYAFAERTHLTAQAIQQQWREVLGIPIHLSSMEAKVYYDLVSKGQFQLALSSWIADYNDAFNFLEVFAQAKRGSNYTGWEDTHYSELLRLSSCLIGKEERRDTLAQCEKILIEAMPAIPIFTFTFLSLRDPRLSGVCLNPAGQLDFKWAKLSNPD